MMVVFASTVVLVVFPEDHFLAARGVLGDEDVGVAEVMVVAPGCLVALVMEGALLVLVAGGGRGWLAVRVAVETLLCELPGEGVVVW